MQVEFKSRKGPYRASSADPWFNDEATQLTACRIPALDVAAPAPNPDAWISFLCWNPPPPREKTISLRRVSRKNVIMSLQIIRHTSGIVKSRIRRLYVGKSRWCGLDANVKTPCPSLEVDFKALVYQRIYRLLGFRRKYTSYKNHRSDHDLCDSVAQAQG